MFEGFTDSLAFAFMVVAIMMGVFSFVLVHFEEKTKKRAKMRFRMA